MKRLLHLVLFITFIGAAADCVAQSGRVKNLPSSAEFVVPIPETVDTASASAPRNETASGESGVVYSAKEVDTKAVISGRPNPRYTAKARRNDTSGVVTLRLVLAAFGEVTNIEVVKGLPDGLTENAIEAARKIRFKPATKDGRPVSQRVLVYYTFKLHGGLFPW